jgi:diguanylate cyclase (GGDEF)-like protein
MQTLRSILLHIHRFLSGQSRRNIIAIALMGIALLGLLDYWSGSEITVSLFYLIPIFVATWYCGLNAGYILTGVSIITWVVANSLAGEKYTYETIRYWNAFVRLVFFGLNVFLLDTLKNTLNDEQQLARTDSLTGAYNRRAFYSLAEMEILRSRRYSHPFTIAYFDLDDFKTVNDRFGHQVGDAVLREFARNIQANTRETDLLARLGGDEFAILLPETDEAGTKKVIRKLQMKLSEKGDLDSTWPTVSIGVITFMSSPGSVDEMLQVADRAMYKAESQGKNQALFARADTDKHLENR